MFGIKIKDRLSIVYDAAILSAIHARLTSEILKALAYEVGQADSCSGDVILFKAVPAFVESTGIPTGLGL